MFSVDYSTLRQIISQFAYTGIFSAEIPGTTRQLRERGRVELLVKDGRILACRFVPTLGQPQPWNDWEQPLSKLGVLDWDLQQQGIAATSFASTENAQPARGSSSPALPVPVQHSPGNILYRSVIVDATTLRQWPQPYRAIYLLIDGNRTALDIAHLLSRNLEDVIPFLDELLKRGIIKMG